MSTNASPRTYRSSLRTQQAEQTRRRIVDAAAREFALRGYQATTMAAIAREAGTSTETVKAAASKAELLIAAFERTFSGTEAQTSLTDTEVGGGLLELPDDIFVDAVVARIAGANAAGYALWTVLLGAAMSDPHVQSALDGILEHRRADYRRLVSELVRRDIAGPGIDTANAPAALSFLLSPEGYQQLVVQSGWTTDAYRRWLRDEVAAIIGGNEA